MQLMSKLNYSGEGSLQMIQTFF